MRLIFLVAVLFSLATIACNNKKGDKVLPPEKMEAVLWDLMRADKFLSDYVLNKDTAKKIDSESIKMYNRIFAIHKITGEQFQKSFTYYKTHPDQLREIMDSISRPANAAPTEMVAPQPVSPTQSTGDSAIKRPDTTWPAKTKKVMVVD